MKSEKKSGQDDAVEEVDASNAKEDKPESQLNMAFSRSGEFLTAERIQGAGMTEEQVLEIFHSQ